MNNYHAPTQFIGKLAKYISTCPSTNSMAFQESLESQIPEGFAWVAGHQSAGRGQRGNTWQAEPDQNLLLSFLLKPPHSLLENQFYLSKAVALGILNGLQNWASENYGEKIPLSIKWPNDLYLDGKKLGGILIENNFQSGQWTFSIVGIGLNINQTNFADLRACSLKSWMKSPQSFDLLDIYKHISAGIEQEYLHFLAQKFHLLDEAYHQKLFRFQEWHSYQDSKHEFIGKILRVNAQGLLIMEKPVGEQVYEIKELSFIFKD
ncbi:biotin--[acetyl-CoA-carboxylase] ligase [Aquirufa ecclesiirivi]|uniref:Biotin--[acetyl-CoA-carboxylase] ligase n=1 Tax=Aquirufa ecclesiirivi TaxID=2715124 RepID=A0ABT4JCJ1_9BACT|nr:biotin--[acetyl-CoA-carboxylase] ligase [Aquirufa ecclesiirivi]MCZ2473817.1 biotin--[acetyl-CoA-carboxylase] ligase [Aquirufa ecclesiirivi]